MGRTLGAPGDNETQRKVIMAALELLENASSPGTIVDLPGHYQFENFQGRPGKQ
ncbi:MAG: hypothetical protein Q8L87_09845 [Anaerolineales bacterium]|jgi:hypothetical protein|nr:hypothetical protein [Anaerolineales bacterium]